MSSQYTFWRLVEEFKIIVPIIQRDYAQGRKDDLKIEQIRKTFIQHLLEKINQNSHKSDLDFVYGSVVDEQLKLLDGQQRLTTLFLLHWYLAWKSDVILDKTIQEKLLRFSYETRTSSRDFIKSLIEQAPNLKCIWIMTTRRNCRNGLRMKRGIFRFGKKTRLYNLYWKCWTK